MKLITDERIRFLLKHRRQIEEWLAVRDDLRTFAHEFYASLREDVIGSLPNGVVVSDLLEATGNSALFRLTRPDWPTGGPAVELG